jgi:apolipoprotein N-acyltransferase
MKKAIRRADDSIHSMVSMLPTLPALLHHIGRPTPRNRFSLRQIAIVLIAGGAHAASMAWPFSFGFAQGQPIWWMQLVAMALLAGPLDAQVSFRDWKRAAWLGGLFATTMLCGTFWWLFISMHTYGGLAAPLTALAVVLLAAFLGLYYAAASGLFVLLAPVGRAQRAIVFASLWLMAELARVQFFTGFPWGEGGYAHVDGWAGPLAAWVGVHGLSFLSAFAAAWLVMSLRAHRTRWTTVLCIVLVSVAVAWLPVQSGPQIGPALEAPGTLSVTLLQGNIPQNEKFETGTGVAAALGWYGEQLQAATSALVVAPETAIPLLPQQLPEGYWQTLKTRFSKGQQAALVGVPLGDAQTGYSNSVVGLKPGISGVNGEKGEKGEPYRYDKHHLVPFGEFIPPGFRWFTNLMNIPLGDFNRGEVGQASFDWKGQRLAVNICYEDLFGEELAARFIDPALAPTMFVNISNIAWFGDSVAIDQHLQISRMRALEFSRPMIRATNTGATVIIDHRSQVAQALPRLTRGTLTGDVEGRSSMTPYAWWTARFGLWPWWLLGLVVAGFAFLKRR